MSVSWTNCTKSTDGAYIEKVTWSPNPPILGENFTVSATGQVKTETVRYGSNYTVTMKYGSVQVLKGTYPLCGESTIVLPLNLGTITLDGLNCPQAPGVPVTLSETVFLPSDSPLGSYSAKLVASDQSRQELLCIEVFVTVST